MEQIFQEIMISLIKDAFMTDREIYVVDGNWSGYTKTEESLATIAMRSLVDKQPVNDLFKEKFNQHINDMIASGKFDETMIEMTKKWLHSKDWNYWWNKSNLANICNDKAILKAVIQKVMEDDPWILKSIIKSDTIKEMLETGKITVTVSIETE